MQIGFGMHSYKFSGHAEASEPSLTVISGFNKFQMDTMEDETVGVILLNINALPFFEFFNDAQHKIALVDQNLRYVYASDHSLIGTKVSTELFDYMTDPVNQEYWIDGEKPDYFSTFVK